MSSITPAQFYEMQARLARTCPGEAGPVAESHSATPRMPGQPAERGFEIRPTTDEAKLNKTERALLIRLRQNWPVVGIQNVTLKLGDDCRYTPDFWTVSGQGEFTFWEAKGFWRDDARVKIKVAARLFTWAKFIAVQRVKGTWRYEEIKP